MSIADLILYVFGLAVAIVGGMTILSAVPAEYEGKAYAGIFFCMVGASVMRGAGKGKS